LGPTFTGRMGVPRAPCNVLIHQAPNSLKCRGVQCIVASMDPNACPLCGGRLFANGVCRCGWPKSDGDHRVLTLPASLTTGQKRCRLCCQNKLVGFFPRDRSRADGRWHTCTLCNKNQWRDQREHRAMQRLRKRIEKRENSRTGIRGLRKYYRGNSQFDSLPLALRLKAEAIWSKSLAWARAEGRRLSQAEIALRKANAVSNCIRVGNRSWSRSMLRQKGYRRAERRLTCGPCTL